MSENHFHSVILYSKDAKVIFEALKSSGHADLAATILEKSKRSKIDSKYVKALCLWDEDNFDMDDDPIVSRGEDGAFVMVWQWIYKEEIHPQLTNEVGNKGNIHV